MKKNNNYRLAAFLPFIVIVILVLLVVAFSAGMLSERKRNMAIVEALGGSAMVIERPVLFRSGKPNNLSTILQVIDRKYVDEVNIDTISDHAIPYILKDLDPHSSYIPAREAAEVQQDLRGDFEGIGIMFNMLTDTVIVQEVIPGGPSSKVGVMAGDRIITVNDSIIAGKNINSNNIVGMLKGPKGTYVKVGIERRGVRGLVDIDIVRDKVDIKSIDVAFMIEPGVGYINLMRFSRTSHKELRDAIRDLKTQGMKSLILDFQNNGGGYFDQAILIANEFLPKDRMIVYTEGRGKRTSEQYANGRGESIGDEVVILINEGSASASEIVAGALQDNDIGTIVGRRSFGKGLVQEEVDLSDGSILLLTVARYYTPTGRSIQRSYDKGENEYYAEVYNRFLNGEVLSRDSIKCNESLRFETPGGKVVYGGGGIVPDVFVPLDTTHYTSFERKALMNIYRVRYAVEYVDANRRTLEKITSKNELDRYYARNIDRIYEGYKSYFVKNTGENGTPKEWARIENDLKSLFRAEIGDATQLKNSAHYIYMKDYDKILKEGIAVARENMKK